MILINFADHRSQILGYSLNQIAEAGLINILVIDERIAERAMKPADISDGHAEMVYNILSGNKYRKPMQWHAAAKAGLYIVTHITVKNSIKSDALFERALCPRNWSKAQKAFNPEISTLPQLKLVLDLDLASEENPLSLLIDQTGDGNEKDVFDLFHMDLAIIHQGVLDSIYENFRGGNDFHSQLIKLF